MFSVKRLMEHLNATAEEAKEVRAILLLDLEKGEPDEREQDSPDYELWHDEESRKLYMVNRAITEHGSYHGVEIIRSADDTMHSFEGISYLNSGDTYGATLMYDHGRDKWILGCWGDIVERQEKRFAEC